MRSVVRIATALLLLAVTPVAAEEEVTTADVVAVDDAGAPWFSETAMAAAERGFGASFGYEAFGPLGGKLEAIAADLGFPAIRGPLLRGSTLSAWFAVTPRLRLGGWRTSVAQTERQAFSRDRIETLEVALTGGGALAEATFPLEHGFARVGAGLGLGRLGFTVGRVLLGTPGSYEEFTDELRTGVASNTWERTLTGTGPLARLRGGADLQVVPWLLVGAEAGWTFFYVPAGSWVDAASGGALAGAPPRGAHGWQAGLRISAGFFPRGR